jgi:hypothetical protein
MEEKTDNNKEFKNKILSFYRQNKKKIYLLTIILLLIFITISFVKISQKKNNILISEKYVQAGLYLSANKNKESKALYEEIIFSKNKFYSILSLNTILEKDLVTEKSKILEYFSIVEKIKKTEEQRDVISLKKALYLIKIKNIQAGNEILKNLIKKNSKLKLLAEEILAK